MMAVTDFGDGEPLVRMQCDFCNNDFAYIAFDGDPPARIGEVYGYVFRSDGRVECSACKTLNMAVRRALREFNAKVDNGEGLPGAPEEDA